MSSSLTSQMHNLKFRGIRGFTTPCPNGLQELAFSIVPVVAHRNYKGKLRKNHHGNAFSSPCTSSASRAVVPSMIKLYAQLPGERSTREIR